MAATTEVTKGPSIIWMMIGLSIATLLDVFDLSVANVSLLHIAGDLGVSPDQSSYVITSYMIGQALALPMVPRVADRLGDVRLLRISLLLFVFFSWTCGSAVNIAMLSICRFLQGLTGGALIPLSQTFIKRFVPKEKLNAMIGLWGAIFILSWVCAPVIGGWIVTHFSWPWVFYINIPLGFVSWFIIWRELSRFNSTHKQGLNDRVGMFGIVVLVVCWQIFLDKGQQLDWWNSGKIQVLSAVILILLLYLIPRWLLHPNPFLNLRLFKKRAFSLSVFLISMICAIDAATLVLIPLWRQTCSGFDAYWAGVSMAPFGIGGAVAAGLNGILNKTIGVRWTIFTGLLLSSYSCFYQVYALNPDIGIQASLFARFFLGAGLMLNFISITSLWVNEFEDHDLLPAVGIFHFFRNIFGALGTTLFIVLWERRGSKHHQDLVETVIPYNADVTNFLSKLQAEGFSPDQSLESLNQILNVQASTLSLNDCLFVMGGICLACIFFLPFGRKSASLVKRRLFENI